MSFLYPAFLAGALAIAIPIALHLLRRDVAPEVPFTAVRLLQRSPSEQPRRKRLRDLLLLAVRVAALLLLAAAFARPYFAAAAGAAPVWIVAIDRSLSMGAPGRFERAQVLAREAVAQAGGPVAVVAFDDRAEVVAAASGAGEARAAIATLRPGYGATRFAPIFARVRELAGDSPAHVVIVSDLQRQGWAEDGTVMVPNSVEIKALAVEPVGGNLAVTGLRTSLDAVSVSIANEGQATISGAVRISVEGAQQTASARFTAAAGATVSVAVPYRAPNRGVLVAAVDDAAGYAGDNERVLLLDHRGGPGVLLIGGVDGQAGFYLTRALQSVEGAGGFEVQERTTAAVGRMGAGDLAEHSVLVLLSTRGLERHARDAIATSVRSGAGLLIVASADVDPALLAAMMGWSDFAAATSARPAGVLAPTDLRHPIFKPFGALAANLGQTHFPRIWNTRGGGWEVAARFTDGSPALLERREGRGRVVLFASDLGRRWNDFPLNPAFVPFAIETVRHTAGRGAERREYHPGDVPPGVRPEPGVHYADGRPVVVNVDPRESVTSVMSPAEFTAMLRAEPAAPDAPADPRAHRLEGQQNLWRYGLLLMALVLAAESIVGRAAW